MRSSSGTGGSSSVKGDAEVIGAFSEEATARLSGLSVGQLRAWDRSGFIRPSYAEGSKRLPYSRVYSFRDIVSLRVLGLLRNKFGVSLQHLRKVSDRLADMGEAKWTGTTLYVLGKKVVFDDPRTQQLQEVLSGQRVFDIPLKAAISDTRRAINHLNQRKKQEVGRISRDRFVMQNDPVFAGTRITVSTVRRYLEAGFTPQQIIAEFPGLTEADVRAAREYRDGNRAA